MTAGGIVVPAAVGHIYFVVIRIMGNFKGVSPLKVGRFVRRVTHSALGESPNAGGLTGQ